MDRTDDYLPIGAYAIIGDCHTMALVGTNGSIDWFCPAQFDGPAVFCRLLDAQKGGSLRIAPVDPCSVTRHYRGCTNVLETTFTTATGQVHLTDLMPIQHRQLGQHGSDVRTFRRLLRFIEGLAGTVELEVTFKPTFGYALAQTELWPVAEQGAVAQGAGKFLTLGCQGVEFQPDGQGGLRARLGIESGQQHWVILAEAPDEVAAREVLRPADYATQLADTLEYWEQWAASCTYHGPYQAQVQRSALTLKLLTYEPTGAVVAAPTTSLPERIGGNRNWDYRYSWLRDSALTLYALMTVGYQAEATDFFHWLVRALQQDPSPIPQPLYRIDGGRNLQEHLLKPLTGYRDSWPVRIGNAAAAQHQLDIFGEVLRAAALHYAPPIKPNGQPRRPPPAVWALLRDLIEQAAERWREPGHGIWEVRSKPKHFLHGKLMCWAALDSGIRLARAYHLQAPLARWRRSRAQLRQAILTEGYNAQLGAFTQAFGSSELDASVLVIPRIGFLAATDPRVCSTVEQIQRRLTTDGLVCRYQTEDGLPPGEGAFLLCSFWLVEALALGGQLEAAHELFERALGYANDLGLFSEEVDPATGELLGNFPQGFTHSGLIGAAVNLAKAGRYGSEQQPETEAARAGRAHRASREAPHHSRVADGSD